MFVQIAFGNAGYTYVGSDEPTTVRLNGDRTVVTYNLPFSTECLQHVANVLKKLRDDVVVTVTIDCDDMVRDTSRTEALWAIEFALAWAGCPAHLRDMSSSSSSEEVEAVCIDGGYINRRVISAEQARIIKRLAE